MVNTPHPGRVDILAGVAIGDDGIVRPPVPQPLHDIHELGGDGIAAGMVRMRAAEIAGGGGVGPRNRIPRSAPMADVVQ